MIIIMCMYIYIYIYTLPCPASGPAVEVDGQNKGHAQGPAPPLEINPEPISVHWIALKALCFAQPWRYLS